MLAATPVTTQSDQGCDEVDQCGVVWEDESFDYEFFNEIGQEWIRAEVVVSTLDTVSSYGERVCIVSVSNDWGNADMECGEIEADDQLQDLGFEDFEKEMLEEAVDALDSKNLGELASKAPERWEKPCIKLGEPQTTYLTRAVADCTAHVSDQLPAIGTLGARTAAAASACGTTRAALAEMHALGENACPAAR